MPSCASNILLQVQNDFTDIIMGETQIMLSVDLAVHFVEQNAGFALIQGHACGFCVQDLRHIKIVRPDPFAWMFLRLIGNNAKKQAFAPCACGADQFVTI